MLLMAHLSQSLPPSLQQREPNRANKEAGAVPVTADGEGEEGETAEVLPGRGPLPWEGKADQTVLPMLEGPSQP